MSHDEGELRRFVESAVGGRVTGLERAATGSSRTTLLVDVEDRSGRARALVLRHDSGDGPLSGTEIDLAHEAVVYRALADRPVRIPKLVSEAADGRSLLIERASGTESLAELDASERVAVERDFGCALAELHAVDPATLPLGEMARPARATEHATLELDRWARFQRENADAPSEISQLAIEWLARNAPTEVDRTALCHGDAGIGNFLHDGARVTALLDWEFAHIGDPLDDIAWVLVRSHVTGGDGMHEAISSWSRESGLSLVPNRIAYFRCLVLLRMAISCEIALAHAARGGATDTTTYEILLPYLGFLLPQALREAGCSGGRLDALEDEGSAVVKAHPILAAVARPLQHWKDER